MVEGWQTSYARDVSPLLGKMDDQVHAVVERAKDDDLAGAWETMQELGQAGEAVHEVMQQYVTGEVAEAMPGPTFEALSDICWASWAWHTAVQEVEAAVGEEETNGRPDASPALVEQIEACAATWHDAQAKLTEAGV